MLDDRDYMRDVEYRPSRWHTATGFILVFNAAIFVLGLIAPWLVPSDYLGLSWAGLRHGFIWQLLTFQFLHAGLLHLALNSIGLFVFGFAVEQFIGRNRFVVLYLASGILGGIVHVLGSLIWPGHFGVRLIQVGMDFFLEYAPMVGASAGLFGLIAAFATMFPERNLTVYLFFVFPVTVSARVLLLVSVAISVLGVLMDRGNVAHGAHAGGMLGGWLMLKYFSRQSTRRARWSNTVETKQAGSAKSELRSDEVDAILEKISRQGIQSLTLRERKILEQARRTL